jgi:hypothetical protein
VKPTTRRRRWPWIVSAVLVSLCIVGCIVGAVVGPPAALVGVVHDDDDTWDAEDCRNAEPDCPWYLRHAKPTGKPGKTPGSTGKAGTGGKVDTKKGTGTGTKPKPRP